MDSFLSAAAARAADATPRLLSLCCNQCGAVVATAEELLCEKAAYLEGAVWAYELDLLDTTAFVYSATNPEATRFDVGRFDSAACARLRFGRDPAIADHSWSPPYRWRNARCQNCPSQVGWVFADENDEIKFAGVIVTALVERRVPVSETLPPSAADLERRNTDPFATAAHLRALGDMLDTASRAAPSDFVVVVPRLLSANPELANHPFAERLRSLVAQTMAEIETDTHGDAVADDDSYDSTRASQGV